MKALAYAEDLYFLFNETKSGKLVHLDILFETFGVSNGMQLKQLFDHIGIEVIKVQPRYNTDSHVNRDDKTEIDSLLEVIEQI